MISQTCTPNGARANRRFHPFTCLCYAWILHFRETWNEWQEDAGEESEINALCLFCDEASEESGKLLEHMKVKGRFVIQDVIF